MRAAGIFPASRLIAVAGQDGYLPKRIGELHADRKTPVNATLLHSLIAMVYLLAGNFKSLITMLGICEWSFYLLTSTSLLVLRIREPTLERCALTHLAFLST